MRLLFVDAAVQSLNPTATLTPHMVGAAVADTTYFGPGFCSHQQIRGGLARFVGETGPYDVVVFGPNSPLLATWENAVADAVRYHHKSSACAPAPNILAEFYHDIIAAAAGLDVPLKAISLLNFDYYGTTVEQVEVIEKMNLSLISPNAQFVMALDELPAFATGEEHFVRKKARLSDAFHDFVTANPERVLTALHFVAPGEFFFRHIEERRADISVPGVEYVQRAQAIGVLKRAGRRMGSKAAFHAYRIANKLGLPAYSSFLPLKLYNLTYQAGLINTRAVYTARGGFGIPVRKFFEIPAAGALMICSPPNGSRAIGFRDGETCIEASPEKLLDTLDRLDGDDEAARIALAGQRMVMRVHSLDARARQLRQCLDAILAGRYAGSHWKDGEFVVETKD